MLNFFQKFVLSVVFCLNLLISIFTYQKTTMKDHLYLFILLLFLCNNRLHGCHLSSYNLVSITGTGPYTITTNLCVGGGRTGATTGGNNETRSIFFGFYSSSPSFVVSSFLPSNITGSFSGCTMPGSNIGALGAPFNSNANVGYIDPGYYGIAPCTLTPFQCITSTALCGNVDSQCINFIFTTNVLPDSIRVFGVEGAGNPVAGCYPDADMQINFNSLLPVFWSSIAAKYTNENTVSLNWTTLSEVNNNFFTIQRINSLEGTTINGNNNHELLDWQDVDIVYGTNRNAPVSYQLIDKNPFVDKTYYRVRQTDFDYKYSYSKIILALNKNKNSEIKIYPNPMSDILNIESKQTKRISIINTLGAEVYGNGNIADELNTIDATEIPVGLYILKIENENGDIHTSKIIKCDDAN